MGYAFPTTSPAFCRGVPYRNRSRVGFCLPATLRYYRPPALHLPPPFLPVLSPCFLPLITARLPPAAYLPACRTCRRLWMRLPPAALPAVSAAAGGFSAVGFLGYCMVLLLPPWILAQIPPPCRLHRSWFILFVLPVLRCRYRLDSYCVRRLYRTLRGSTMVWTPGFTFWILRSVLPAHAAAHNACAITRVTAYAMRAVTGFC